MKKLLVFIVALLLIFLFRDRLNPYWIRLYSHVSENEPTGWLAKESENIYRDLPNMDFDTAIISLERFEEKVSDSLANIDAISAGEDDRRLYHRNLICELAVVYKKLALLHMSRGNDDLYITYTRKSQEKLAQCADLNPNGFVNLSD